MKNAAIITLLLDPLVLLHAADIAPSLPVVVRAKDPKIQLATSVTVVAV